MLRSFLTSAYWLVCLRGPAPQSHGIHEYVLCRNIRYKEHTRLWLQCRGGQNMMFCYWVPSLDFPFFPGWNVKAAWHVNVTAQTCWCVQFHFGEETTIMMDEGGLFFLLFPWGKNNFQENRYYCQKPHCTEWDWWSIKFRTQSSTFWLANATCFRLRHGFLANDSTSFSPRALERGCSESSLRQPN